MHTNLSSNASNVSATVTATATATATSSSFPSSSLKRKSNDVGWDYGELSDSKGFNAVKCKFCRSIFKGGIYRLNCHLAHYGTNVKKCQKVSNEAKKRCWEALAWVKIAKDQKAQELAEIREVVVNSLKMQQGMKIDIDAIDIPFPP
ncbi:hypothetical protein SLEP1_g24329 [Rubroshorea leprosula]|uniref:BED-type domain-containing protein n=1 Tax=Rubroshorea leprosula TaxID=152421 RepID=A0AAV5JSH8_9ROSI|nr:hypothetical protein SLEP1_g24329 [Rubroshorea leprosula]